MKKYIYMLAREYISAEREAEEVILRASNDIKNILDAVSFKQTFYNEIILVIEENTTVDSYTGSCDSISFSSNSSAEYFKKYPSHVFDGDENEKEYIYECLKEWEDNRIQYLEVKKMMEESERVAEVKTLTVEMICDKCGNGKMIRSGNIILCSEPLKYPHKCNSCGYEKNYPFPYPYQRLVPLEPLRKPVNNEIG